MGYAIYFDESNKLDQPNGGYSYYGALGSKQITVDDIINSVENLGKKSNLKSELHFVDYTGDNDFEKYFRTLSYTINQDIKVNLMIVNNEDAREISKKMNVTLTQLRELFYVKIPERLFYGVTRNLGNGEKIHITIDENNEYEKLNLQSKLEEQMNAHSAYRNKGYKVDSVRQASSLKSIPLQIVDVFIGIVVFLMEKQYKNIEQKDDNIALQVKSDLIYRFIIHNENLKMLHQKVTLYKWEGEGDQIINVSLSEYTGDFIIFKAQFDIREMGRLEKIRIENPNQSTKFYRESMGYGNGQLKTIQGYIDELDGKGRNSYYSGY